MSTIEFATNDHATARRFLDGEKMDYLTEDTKNFILDGVERGLCRVRDPYMYGGSSGVVPTGCSDEVNDFMREVEKRTMRDYKNRPKQVTLLPKDIPDGFRLQVTHWDNTNSSLGRHEFWCSADDDVFDLAFHLQQIRRTIQEHGEGTAGLCWRVVGPSYDAKVPTEADLLDMIGADGLGKLYHDRDDEEFEDEFEEDDE